MKRSLIAQSSDSLLVAVAAPGGAQSRPLVTEDPETVPAGNILLEAGIDYATRRVLSGVGPPRQPMADRHVRFQLWRQFHRRDPDRRRSAGTASRSRAITPGPAVQHAGARSSRHVRPATSRT